MTSARTALTSSTLAPFVPYLALLTGMVSLAIGTSFAKHLFPVVGA